MRRDIEGAQIGHMIGGVIGLIFANRYAAAGLLGLFHWLAKNGNKVKIFFCCPVFLTFLNFWNVVILVNRGFLLPWFCHLVSFLSPSDGPK